jgi:phage protein U
MWGSYGDIIFTLDGTPRAISDMSKYKYAAHGIIGRYPRHEFLGEDEHGLDMEIILSRVFCDPADMHLALSSYATDGLSQPLIVGQSYEGDFVIESVKRTFEDTDTSGNIVTLKLQIKLTEVRE